MGWGGVGVGRSCSIGPGRGGATARSARLAGRPVGSGAVKRKLASESRTRPGRPDGFPKSRDDDWDVPLLITASLAG